MSLIAERYGERFGRRVFTERELADCGMRAESLAARWAAKEAVAKALGTGFGPVGYLDIEVVQDEARLPARASAWAGSRAGRGAGPDALGAQHLPRRRDGDRVRGGDVSGD